MPGGRKVQVNYDELSNIANQFSQESASADQLFNQVMGLVNDLQGGGWIGRGAQAFFSEMRDEVEPGMNRLTQALEDASSALKQISGILSNAESDASSLFTRR